MGLAVVGAVIGLFEVTWPAQALEDALQTDAQELALHVEGGLVSAEMVNVPLAEAVTELARRSGFELVLEGEFDRRISLTRSDLTVAELLSELLQSCSWFSAFDADGAETQVRLSQVWILQSPECGDPHVAGSEWRSPPNSQMRHQESPSSVIDKRDLRERQKHLGRVISGQIRASIDELLEATRDDRDVSIRILALMALGRSGGPKAKATLVEALSDENLAVRAVAIRSLTRGWKEQAVAPINSLLSTETERRVVRVAVQQLRQIGTDAAWDGLRRAADSDDLTVSSLAQKAIVQLEADTNR